VRRGHGLGNHSYAHWRSAALRSTRRLTDDFARAQALLERAGARGRWFRPPIGILSPQVVRAAERAGLQLVGWTRSARDGVASTTVERACARLIGALAPGAILVLHDGVERGGRRPIAPEVLPALLDALDARGLKSVTLDELFGDAPGKV
ncbi:MAG TPA: polysaccharide deacetylase family protein, partial [Polyangia bacterium]|nr:polysaccharide deacetylase family protein [Polyangia bacterium]